MCRTFLFVYKDNLWRILFTLWKIHQKKSDFIVYFKGTIWNVILQRKWIFPITRLLSFLRQQYYISFFENVNFLKRFLRKRETPVLYYIFSHQILYFLQDFLYIFLYLFILSIFWIDFRGRIIIVRVSNIKKHLENEKNRSIRSSEHAFICMFKEWRCLSRTYFLENRYLH